MRGTPRNLLLVSLVVVAWAVVVTAAATLVWPPPTENPTCRQLRRDGELRRYTVVRLVRDIDPPPRVTRPERTVIVERALAAACPQTGREGRRRPLGADLRGTVSRRLRELEARRR
jgi:hypothetical protein